YNGFLEMQHWLNAGVSLEKIFMAATYNNAKAFRIDKEYGTITQGKIANLLLLNKNPLEDITAYDAINSVIVHGQSYDRHTLSANQSN
ncbi:MAG: amidohydrolase family protein, partial [Lutimonas sp.]